MPEYTETLSFSSIAELEATVAASGSWAALATFTVAGVLIERSQTNDLFYVQGYLGDPGVPRDVRQLRKSTHQVMRRMGQPVIVKHMFNDRDARLGIAQSSPTALDPTYGNQVRDRDPFSHGVGYCSVQLSDDEWIDPRSGQIVNAPVSPGAGFVQAPKYRGYGPGYLTYIIEPDVPLDLFKLNSTGAIIKVQSQTVQAGWFPEINDNDLIVNVELDDDGNVVDTHERYQAKRTTPITIRGFDNRGRREYSADHGNRHVINQQFEMNTVPDTSVLNQVETDR